MIRKHLVGSLKSEKQYDPTNYFVFYIPKFFFWLSVLFCFISGSDKGFVQTMLSFVEILHISTAYM